MPKALNAYYGRSIYVDLNCSLIYADVSFYLLSVLVDGASLPSGTSRIANGSQDKPTGLETVL